MPRLLLVCAVLAGCAGTPTTDAGLDPDSGIPDAGAAPEDAGVDAGPPLGTPGTTTRTLSAWPDRAYDLHIPAGYDGRTPLPLIVVLHGGGGNRSLARKTACPAGDTASPACLDALADARGFITVYPDGTPGPVLQALRTFNAGGGADGWQCVSGPACTRGIDERAYFTELLADVQRAVHVDLTRLYATGFSNGAAMAHRLACELPFSAVVSVAGGNQFSTTRPCARRASVVEIHGTADPCWSFDGGPNSCADMNPGDKLPVQQTMDGWRARNDCGSVVDTAVPDTMNDGTTTTRRAASCDGGLEVVLYDVQHGGHTWPGGATSDNGPTATDFSANEVLLDFFARH